MKLALIILKTKSCYMIHFVYFFPNSPNNGDIYLFPFAFANVMTNTIRYSECQAFIQIVHYGRI